MQRLFRKRMHVATAIALIVLAGFLRTTAGRAYCHSEFHKYFEGLGAAEARVNPVERLLFSVLLTRMKPDTPAVSQNPAKQL
jgi:hypothetical protein